MKIAEGWRRPSLWTLRRRLEREVSPQVRMLARRGQQALDGMLPSQQRSRADLHALHLVNADGHTFDVFCAWPDGQVGRPVMIAWQDIYSGKLLSWRLDKKPSAELVRLSFGDVAEGYGIPQHAILDNGREFASKWLTGRMKTRFRFKIKPEEPAGILTQLGVQVHWATPYHGQAKPIERAFRDLCESIAKHPACAGAYTGHTPAAKPENYGSRAIPSADFEALAGQEIAAHNARTGRRGGVCAGRSCDAVFAESYAESPILKATAAQRALWLLAAEGVAAHSGDGSVRLAGNRYWHEALAAHLGKRLVLRCDPQRLHHPVHIYTPDGLFICTAEPVGITGFTNAPAAQEHASAKCAARKATRAQLAAERRLSASEVAAGVFSASKGEGAPPPQAKIIQGMFRQQARQQEEDAAAQAHFRAGLNKTLEALRRQREQEAM